MSGQTSPYCNCLFFSSSAFARALARMADEEFAVTGLSPSHGFILMTVDNEPGITLGKVAKTMMLTPSTVTRLIEKLEHKALLYREVTGRTTSVYPTDTGREKTVLIRQAWASLFERYSALIGREEGKRLSAELTEALVKLET